MDEDVFGLIKALDHWRGSMLRSFFKVWKVNWKKSLYRYSIRATENKDLSPKKLGRFDIYSRSDHPFIGNDVSDCTRGIEEVYYQLFKY
jgi:hypothetical protein